MDTLLLEADLAALVERLRAVRDLVLAEEGGIVTIEAADLAVLRAAFRALLAPPAPLPPPPPPPPPAPATSPPPGTAVPAP